jgi:head-tail adaptor
MSLLDEAYEDYTILNKVKTSDGYGGTVTTWTDGAVIQGAIVFDSSIQARTAQAQGVSSVYTLTTHRNVVLEYHDVLRRERDKKIFRVTSDGDDKFTPKSATLDMRQVTCEEWKIPSEVTNG